MPFSGNFSLFSELFETYFTFTCVHFFFRDEPRKCKIFNSKKIKILITEYIHMYYSRRGNRSEYRYFLMEFFVSFIRIVRNKLLCLNKVKIFITKYRFNKFYLSCLGVYLFLSLNVKESV